MIRDDWQRYEIENGTTSIRALDSIFTVPPRRLRQLMELISDSPGPVWEGFSRAASVKDQQYVDMLTDGRCSQLSIGFESMSDDVLVHMNKKVTVAQNRRANQLLKGSSVGCRGHFLVGYPGETPQDFAQTEEYLRREYAGEFKLSIFSFTDETMPVWKDAERLEIQVDPQNPEYGWSHVGMNVNQAQSLHVDAIKKTRWDSDDAVWLFWQRDYQAPLVPGNNRWHDLYVQKLVERLAFLPRDVPNPRTAKRHLDTILWQLKVQGVELSSTSRMSPAI
jgi:anaerobic magnesium-protoporphyrin IX monomethyl ester cyclase